MAYDATKKAELLAIIQQCIENQGLDNFEQSADYTDAVALALASDLNTKLTAYTDGEIDKLRLLIGSDDVDLQPITDLLALIKGQLDGDDEQDGFQALNALMSDVASNKQLVAAQGQTISSLMQQITTLTNTVNSNTNRIAALENAAPATGVVSTDDAVDQVLVIMQEVNAAACTASRTALTTAITARSAARVASFVAALAPDEPDPTDPAAAVDDGTVDDGTGGDTGALGGMG